MATLSHPSATKGANTFGSLPGYSMLSVVWRASALPSLRATKGVPLTLTLGKRRVKHLGLLGFRVNPMLVTADLYRDETYPVLSTAYKSLESLISPLATGQFEKKG